MVSLGLGMVRVCAVGDNWESALLNCKSTDNYVEDSSTETMAELANRVARCRSLGRSPLLCNIVYSLQHTDMYS